jgi:hypothetical protein
MDRTGMWATAGGGKFGTVVGTTSSIARLLVSYTTSFGENCFMQITKRLYIAHNLPRKAGLLHPIPLIR